MDEKLDFEPLNYLFNASDKQTISKAFQEAFRCRFSGLSDIRKQRWCQTFEIGKKDIDALFGIVLYLINTILYHNMNDGNEILKIFPASFNDKLKKGIAKILLQNYDYWKTASNKTSISAVPKLIDFEWRLDVKRSSNTVSYMAEPTVMVSMQIQEPQQKVGVLAPSKQVQFEMGGDSLNVMIDGLRRIRDQLKKL
eukprot:CAMPEP_0197036074 /NCGR_PEP_ID=MMETSP1384-20130603/13689_1 /TAXON_ID=29189 /ORGANISM="Ammonia sp." /LENGTH=195 /DNA_ID=CAMNT_0042466207 /DNA_START=31 /DNA_END=618 /DNA_ORIENTATION=+